MLKMSRKGFQVQEDRKKRETEKEQQKLLTNIDYIQGEMDTLKEKMNEIDEKEESLHMQPRR